MADHLRQQIRDAARTALTGLATTGANVFSGRVSPLKDDELPALLIYLNLDDTAEGAGNGGATADHNGTLRIEGVARANDELVDTLDLIAAEVEAKLFSDAAFLALLMVTPSPPSTVITIDEPIEGLARRLGTAVMIFPIQFRTRLGDPTTRV